MYDALRFLFLYLFLLLSQISLWRLTGVIESGIWLDYATY